MCVTKPPDENRGITCGIIASQATAEYWACKAFLESRLCGWRVPTCRHLLVETSDRRRWCLSQIFNVQLPLVFLIQPVEFGLHKPHELLLGDLAIGVVIHQE